MFGKLIEGLSDLIGVHTREQALELIHCKNHPQTIQQHRAKLINRRLSFFALVFAILVPGWILIEALFLPSDIWQPLALLRILSGVAFAVIWYLTRNNSQQIKTAITLLTTLLFIPMGFVLVATAWLDFSNLTETQIALVSLIDLMPYLVIAALSLFPLTVREFHLIGVPLLLIGFWINWQGSPSLDVLISHFWLLILLLGTSFFSSVNQMRDMISQVTRASFDELTQAMTRRAGIQTIEMLYKVANLQNQPLSVLFADIDHFKRLNDTFGHATGDDCLKSTVESLKKSTRSSDIIIRWGGEEFLILMPNTDETQAKIVIERMYEAGFGEDPKGGKVTLSMGLANTFQEKATHWKPLIEVADERLYHAKESGRARCIGHDNQLLYSLEK